MDVVPAVRRPLDRGAAVEPWPTGVGAIVLFQADVAAAKRFYGEVFGLPVVYEDDDSAVFKFGETLINLLSTTAAVELVEPGAVGSVSPAGDVRAVYTIDVEDVDAICAELARRGVTLLNGPMDRPWGPRTASFRDPGGHVWEIAS
jgi:catechol 2,3-dioxygenase-like lactoylglutathione lyase family enzyme